MRTVLGVDLGTQCGIAVIRDGVFIHHRTYNLKPKLQTTNAQRFLRGRLLFQDLISEYKPTEIYYEEVWRFMSADSSKVYCGLLSQLLVATEEAHLTSVGFSPTAIKRFATQSGKAKKEDMIRAAREQYSIDPKDDNEADALHIAMMGFKSL